MDSKTNISTKFSELSSSELYGRRRIDNDILGNKGLNESAKSQALYLKFFFLPFPKTPDRIQNRDKKNYSKSSNNVLHESL